MREDVKSLSSKIDNAMQLCKNVLDYGEKIRDLSPMDTDSGMEAYARELTLYTEERGRATRIAIKELNVITEEYHAIEKDSTAHSTDKAFLSEKIRSLQDLSLLFAKQDATLRKIVGLHLNSLRKDSVEFHHNVNIIKSYLQTPDKRTFYG